MAVAAAVTAVHVIGFALAGAASDAFVDELRAGGTTLDVFTTYDLVTTALLPLQVLALVLTGLWLLKLRRFAERVQPRFDHARSRWWAFGGWVVPVVSFWFPYQYVRDVRDALHPVGWRHGPLVGWWWAGFLVLLLVEQVSGRFAMSQDPVVVEQLPVVDGVLAATALVALVLWVRVVRDVQRAVDEVPAEIVQGTAYVPDPEGYDPHVAAPGQQIYGPAGPTAWGPGPG